jgi:hypothetical protein
MLLDASNYFCFAERAHRFPVVGTLLPSSERQCGLRPTERFQAVMILLPVHQIS